MGGDNEGEGGRVFRNNYKGHMDKTKVGSKPGKKEGLARVGSKHRQL